MNTQSYSFARSAKETVLFFYAVFVWNILISQYCRMDDFFNNGNHKIWDFYSIFVTLCVS